MSVWCMCTYVYVRVMCDCRHGLLEACGGRVECTYVYVCVMYDCMMHVWRVPTYFVCDV